MDALTSNEIKMSIMDAFQNHARLVEARKPERYKSARKELSDIEDDLEREGDDSDKLIDEIFSTSSSEDEVRPLVLKIKANLSLITSSK